MICSHHTILLMSCSHHNILLMTCSHHHKVVFINCCHQKFFFIYYKNKQHVHFNQNLFAQTLCMVYCVPAMATFMIFSYLVVFSQFHKYMKNWTKNIKWDCDKCEPVNDIFEFFTILIKSHPISSPAQVLLDKKNTESWSPLYSKWHWLLRHFLKNTSQLIHPTTSCCLNLW